MSFSTFSYLKDSKKKITHISVYCFFYLIIYTENHSIFIHSDPYPSSIELCMYGWMYEP